MNWIWRNLAIMCNGATQPRIHAQNCYRLEFSSWIVKTITTADSDRRRSKMIIWRACFEIIPDNDLHQLSLFTYDTVYFEIRNQFRNQFGNFHTHTHIYICSIESDGICFGRPNRDQMPGSSNAWLQPVAILVWWLDQRFSFFPSNQIH